MPITISLEPAAEEYLRTKVTKCRGHGRYLSTLLLAEAAREDERHQLMRQRRDNVEGQDQEEEDAYAISSCAASPAHCD